MPVTKSDKPDAKPVPPAGAAHGAAEVRSESLLAPGDGQDDGRFAVAEEVSLDQQSDAARRIGSLPPDPAPRADLAGALADALAGALTPAGAAQPASTARTPRVKP